MANLFEFNPGLPDQIFAKFYVLKINQTCSKAILNMFNFSQNPILPYLSLIVSGINKRAIDAASIWRANPGVSAALPLKFHKSCPSNGHASKSSLTGQGIT